MRCMKPCLTLGLIAAVFFCGHHAQAKTDKRLSLKNCYELSYPDKPNSEWKIKIFVNLPKKKIIIEELSIKDHEMPTGTLSHHLKKPYEIMIGSENIDADGYLIAKGDDIVEGYGVSINVEIFPRSDGTLGAGAKIDVEFEETGFSYYPQQMIANIVKCP